LKGRYYWERRSPESLEKSKNYFSEAIARDPNYAMAYVGLADYYNVVTDYSPIPAREAAPKARAAAEKALAIDDSLPEAHNAMAAAYWSLLDFGQSEREFQRTLQLNPNYSNAHHWYGLLLCWTARSGEGLPHLRRAVELDPLNLQYNANLGQGLAVDKQFDAAIEQLKKTLDMDANFFNAHGQLRVAYRDTGKYDLWLQEWQKADAISEDREDGAMAKEVAEVYAKAGYAAAAKRSAELLEQLAKRHYVDPAFVGYEYAYTGDKEQTFAWLQKAAAERSGGLQVIKIARPLDPWRSDPRYVAIVKGMGLEP
jgi:Tfp pilus assembly protein PilF